MRGGRDDHHRTESIAVSLAGRIALVTGAQQGIGKGIVLAVAQDDKVHLIAGVTANGTDKISAGELVNFVAQQVGGKGGGRADFAQAGGNQPENLDNALASVEAWVQKTLLI